MSVSNFVRNAATIAAATLLPAQAIAASPVSAAFDNLRASASLDEENDQFSEFNDYLVPVIVVLAIGIGIYFIVDGNEEDDSSPLPTSP